MLLESLKTKRCIMVCGGGGVGKTTTAAAIAVAATHHRDRVLVVTIDPAKRLAEAFGFSPQELFQGGEPKLMDAVRAQALGVRTGAQLSVGILNPQYVLSEILNQVLSPEQRAKLTSTVLYQQLSEMVYGLQEYTAYEWVTRMLSGGTYDLIILDTPPAFHAKDFFNVPEKIQNLMQSRVFQIFMPKKPGFLSSLMGGVMQFPWVEKLLGARIFSESRLFFETFQLLRERILERCRWLAQFFQDQQVSIVAVSTIERSAQLELEGLIQFLNQKNIQVSSVLLNQLEQPPEAQPEWEQALRSRAELLLKKWLELQVAQQGRADRAQSRVLQIREHYRLGGVSRMPIEVLALPMIYSEDGLQILRESSEALRVGESLPR